MEDNKNFAGLFFGDDDNTYNLQDLDLDDYSLLKPLRTLTPEAKNRNQKQASHNKRRSRKTKHSSKGSRKRWKDKEVVSYWMDSVN